eukprot:5625160-Pyramimonas_sp.AAC.1
MAATCVWLSASRRSNSLLPNLACNSSLSASSINGGGGGGDIITGLSAVRLFAGGFRGCASSDTLY